jgi:hypothetical protein
MSKVASFIAALTLLSLSGCTNMLPSSKQDDSNRWKDFEEVKKSYDLIIPYTTDMDAVRKLGFDPFVTPNTQILNYSQVVKAVLPIPIQEQLTIPQGIMDCMKAQEGCVGYMVEPSRIHHKRTGNFMLDFMNFKRDTLTTGWKFAALIVVIENKVVYKQWSGNPNIKQNESQKNPLGPFQGSGGKILP